MPLRSFKGEYGVLGLRYIDNRTVCDSVQVLKESFKLYRAINDGIINLVDKVIIFWISYLFLLGVNIEVPECLPYMCAIVLIGSDNGVSGRSSLRCNVTMQSKLWTFIRKQGNRCVTSSETRAFHLHNCPVSRLRGLFMEFISSVPKSGQ